jgi:hypothetical protein
MTIRGNHSANFFIVLNSSFSLSLFAILNPFSSFHWYSSIEFSEWKNHRRRRIKLGVNGVVSSLTSQVSSKASPWLKWVRVNLWQRNLPLNKLRFYRMYMRLICRHFVEHKMYWNPLGWFIISKINSNSICIKYTTILMCLGCVWWDLDSGGHFMINNFEIKLR